MGKCSVLRFGDVKTECLLSLCHTLYMHALQCLGTGDSRTVGMLFGLHRLTLDSQHSRYGVGTWLQFPLWSLSTIAVLGFSVWKIQAVHGLGTAQTMCQGDRRSFHGRSLRRQVRL